MPSTDRGSTAAPGFHPPPSYSTSHSVQRCAVDSMHALPQDPEQRRTGWKCSSSGPKGSRAVVCNRGFPQAPPERPHLLEPVGHVAHDSRDPDERTRGVHHRHNGELERDPRPVLAQAWDSQQITLTVAALPTVHHALVLRPV